MAEMLNTDSGQAVNNDHAKQYGDAPILFFQEISLFGKRKPEKGEWLKNTELYSSLSNVIDASHITGLQRVNGMWRIYVDNLEDKVALLNEGIKLRGKKLPLLNTNPNRLDSEDTLRVRIKNIPLSVEDGTITRPLILKGVDVIHCMREKLRYNGKLTNCETGDRLFKVKAATLKEPLPRTMAFGKFIGRVIHDGQNKEVKNDKCRKCLEDGHVAANCPNEWKCLICKQSGHKKGECSITTPQVDPPETVENESGTQNDGIPTNESDKIVQENTKTTQQAKPPKQSVVNESVKQNNEIPASETNNSVEESTETMTRREAKALRRAERKQNEGVSKGQLRMDSFCTNTTKTPNQKRSNSLKAKNRTPPSPEVNSLESKKKSKTRDSCTSDSDPSDVSSNED